MKITKEALKQIIKEEIEAVLNKELVKIHGARGLKNGRDVYYMQDKSDESDAGQRPELSIESQEAHCLHRQNPGYYSGLPAENVKWDGEKCVYDYPDDQEVDEGLTKSQADKARKKADKARRDREARERGEKEDTSVDLGFDLGAMMRQNRPKKKRNR